MTDQQEHPPVPTPGSAQGLDSKVEGGCPVAHGSVTSHGSESENPAIDSPQPKAHRPRTVADWWPNQLDLSVLHATTRQATRSAQHSATARSSRSSTSRRSSRTSPGPDHLPGLVARGLRPLRRPDDPDELACRRHLPRPGWPRRCRGRQPAVRAAQQLAGQRQPRQGPAAAMAGEAEVRPKALLGRPARPRGQRGPRVDGLQDLWLRFRPRGRVGARGDFLGTRGHLARRRTLHRRRPDVGGGRLHRDGPDLRQPRGADGQSGPAGGRGIHPRDLQAHGDERRGDRRADRRRPHVRQDPRRR